MKIGALFAILIIVIQVVSAILANQAKRKEKERQQQGRAMPRPVRGTPPAASGRPVDVEFQVQVGGAPEAAESIEAQRRAQIEQLRLRREARMMTGGTGPATGRAPRRIERVVLSAPGGVPTAEQGQAQRHEQLQREINEAIQRASQSETERIERARRTAAARRRSTEPAHEGARPGEQPATIARAAALASGLAPTESVRQFLSGGGHSLRSAVILKEILDRPVGLRTWPE
jgi:type IV secretory pathway VirB10-like protein